MAAMRYIVTKVERETAKAVLCEFLTFYSDGTEGEPEHKWLPKSQIEEYKAYADGSVAYKVPMWLANRNGIQTTTKKVVDSLK